MYNLNFILRLCAKLIIYVSPISAYIFVCRTCLTWHVTSCSISVVMEINFYVWMGVIYIEIGGLQSLQTSWFDQYIALYRGIYRVNLKGPAKHRISNFPTTKILVSGKIAYFLSLDSPPPPQLFEMLHLPIPDGVRSHWLALDKVGGAVCGLCVFSDLNSLES